MFCYFVFCWICFSLFFIIFSLFIYSFSPIICLFVYSFFSNSFNLKCSAFSIRFFPFPYCIWWFVDTLYVAICFESRILFFSYIFADKWNAYVFLQHKNVSKWTSSNGFSCMSHVKASIHLLSTRAMETFSCFATAMVCAFEYSYSNKYDKKSHSVNCRNRAQFNDSGCFGNFVCKSYFERYSRRKWSPASIVFFFFAQLIVIVRNCRIINSCMLDVVGFILAPFFQYFWIYS